MWSPRGFADFERLYPETPPFEVQDAAPTVSFAEAWERWSPDEVDGILRARAGDLRIAMVRGFLGNYMPGNLVAPVRALRALGLDAVLLRNAAGATVDANADALARQLGRDDTPLVLCGHSKGGLECLRLADRYPQVERRLVGIVLSQTPRGPSAVLESLLLRKHQDSLGGSHRAWAEAAQRLGLFAVNAHRGGRELTTRPMADLRIQLDAVTRDYHVWQTASWSETPTTWLDSFHERLGEIRPRRAHDGQFWLEDLVWPGIPHLLLPRVDHAQPVMGGHGFDHVRYWKIVLALFLEGRSAV